MNLCLECIERMKDFIVDHPTGRLYRNSVCSICNTTETVFDISESDFLFRFAWIDLARSKGIEKVL